MDYHIYSRILVDSIRFELMTVRLWAGYSNQTELRILVEQVRFELTHEFPRLMPASILLSHLSIAPFGSPNRTRTCDQSINSRLLYLLSYRGIIHHMLLLNIDFWLAYITTCNIQIHRMLLLNMKTQAKIQAYFDIFKYIVCYY